MLLWLAHRAWNLFWDPQGDCLGRRGVFLSCDFGLPRIGSSSAIHSSSLDSLHSSSGTSSSSTWALGLKWNWPKPLEPSGPTIAPQNHAARLLRWRRILTFSDLHHGRLSLVSLWVPRFLHLPMAHSWRFGVRGALSSMLSFWG